jgi:hypothetical protein
LGITLLVGRQDQRHRLRIDRLGDRVGLGGEEAIDLMRPGIGFDLMPRLLSNVVQMPAKANSGRFSLSANEEGLPRPPNHAPTRSKAGGRGTPPAFASTALGLGAG